MSEHTAVQGWDRPGHQRRNLLLGGAAIAAVVVVGLVVALAVAGARSTPEPARLEAVAATSDADFTPSVTLGSTELTGAATDAADRVAQALPAEPNTGSRVAPGDTPGLYGGTGSDTCDTAALAEFLSNDAGKAAAWAAVLGTTPDGIADYLAATSPLLLAHDTVVTNHDYVSGRAAPFQAVLQAGTAVLVDASGVPRVRCACGNPLGPALSQPLGPVPTGEPWPGYDPATAVAIAPTGSAATTEQVIDVATGELVERPVGPAPRDPCAGAAGRCVQVATADVDGDGAPDPVGVAGALTTTAEGYASGGLQVRVALRTGTVVWSGTAKGIYDRTDGDPLTAAFRGAFELTPDPGAELFVLLVSGRGPPSQFRVLTYRDGALTSIDAPAPEDDLGDDVWAFTADATGGTSAACTGTGADTVLTTISYDREADGTPTASGRDHTYRDGRWLAGGTRSAAPLSDTPDYYAPLDCPRVDQLSDAPRAAPTTPTTSAAPRTTTRAPTTTTTAAPTTTASAAGTVEYGRCFSRGSALLGPRPSSLEYGCDGTGSISGISWSSWGVAGASGRGTARIANCVPDCAGGPRESVPVTITLSGAAAVPTLAGCTPAGTLFYSTLVVGYLQLPSFADPADYSTIDGVASDSYTATPVGSC